MTELARLERNGATICLRTADASDLAAIVALLADDPLGAQRDHADADGLDSAYLRAFEAIDADRSQLLVVAQSGSRVVATMQLSFLPGLARHGALRTQIEAVRVHSDCRGQRLGNQMIQWAIDEARRRGSRLVQLTSDKRRGDAHRFYERLGFTATHEGFKLTLDDP